MSGDWGLMLKSLFSLPFVRQEGVLWFMYVLLGLYILAPVISPWLNLVDKKTLQFYLLLWGVSLMYPWLKPFIQIEESVYGVLYDFSGFSGYFVWGYYLRRFGIDIKFSISICLLLLSFVLPILFKLFIEPCGLKFGDIFWYLSIDSPVLVVLWWNILKHISAKVEPFEKVKQFCILCSNLSFGVYLCHILIQRYWLWHAVFILKIQNYVIQTLVIIFVTIVLSFLLSITTSTYFILNRPPLQQEYIVFLALLYHILRPYRYLYFSYVGLTQEIHAKSALTYTASYCVWKLSL